MAKTITGNVVVLLDSDGKLTNIVANNVENLDAIITALGESLERKLQRGYKIHLAEAKFTIGKEIKTV